MGIQEYHTFYDYMKQANLTASEEDYIEMIYRLAQPNKIEIRVNELATSLNIKSSSVTKMIKKLNEKNLIIYERYGKIRLTNEGWKVAHYLYQRHHLIYQFLQEIGVQQDLLDETEKMEHTVGQETLQCLNKLIDFFIRFPQIREQFHQFKKRQ